MGPGESQRAQPSIPPARASDGTSARTGWARGGSPRSRPPRQRARRFVEQPGGQGLRRAAADGPERAIPDVELVTFPHRVNLVESHVPHVAIRKALKALQTRPASRASSKTRSMLPVWSASSWVSHTQRRAAGSTIDDSASTKSVDRSRCPCRRAPAPGRGGRRRSPGALPLPAGRGWWAGHGRRDRPGRGIHRAATSCDRVTREAYAGRAPISGGIPRFGFPTGRRGQTYG